MTWLRAIRTALARPAARGRALGIVAALLWCFAAALLLPPMPMGSVRAAVPLPGINAPTSPPGSSVPTATTNPAGTPTGVTSPSPSGSPEATATKGALTPTVAATATTDNGGGDNGGGPIGPQPTRVNLGQPGVGNSDNGGGISSFSPAQLTSNGLIIFTTLGCLLGVGGIAALAIGGISLVSDGWGPLLVALLLGNRRGRRQFARKASNDGWGR
jgi:hypothetical protein